VKFEKRLSALIDNFEKRLSLEGIVIPDSGLIGGSDRPIPWKDYSREGLSCGWDNLHFPLGYAFALNIGLPGIVSRAGVKNAEPIDTNEAYYRHAIARVYTLLLQHIESHRQRADELSAMARTVAEQKRLLRISLNLKALVLGPPETFEQGLQLFWLLFRARTPAGGSCLGRLDSALWPLYERDLRKMETSGEKNLYRKEAMNLLCELWQKMNNFASGDTLMNIMLGGVDAEGRDSWNDLSLLMMEAAVSTGGSEPHINVRIHGNMKSEYREAVIRLIAQGNGQGVIYDDDCIIPALTARGIPLKVARLYANDGCTEITFDGLSGIRFWQMEMVKTLELTLFRGTENPCRPHKKISKWNHHGPVFYFESGLTLGYDSGDIASAKSFQDVWDCFERQFRFQINKYFEKIEHCIIDDKDTGTTIGSLLVAGTLPESLDKGRDPLRGGFTIDNYQFLSGSIPTAADGLTAIKKMIFEKHWCDIPRLLTALASNFKDEEILRQQMLQAPKYGNGESYADEVAAKIADLFCSIVEQHRFPHGIQVLPGLYNIDFIMFASILGATPDGRLAGDPIGEHFSPTPGQAKNGPTALLHSASTCNLPRGCAASPVHLSLPASTVKDINVITGLMSAIHVLGLPIVSITVYDPEELRDAMVHPESHEDLIVRVWGYNAHFTDLTWDLQNHILTRILNTKELP
jgi:formate C-acetyltransferase